MKGTLIVDDMKEVYDKISPLFKNPKHAGSFEEGMKEVASGNYKLIISDYDLGEDYPQGGLEIMRVAKDKGLKRILMSKENHKEEAKELGAIFSFKKELFKIKNIKLSLYNERKQNRG